MGVVPVLVSELLRTWTRWNVSFLGMRLFCLQLEASCLQWSFLLTVDHFSFFTYSWSSCAYSFSFSTYSWSFFAYSGELRLVRALRDCKQRSLTVSKKAPTVSQKAPPVSWLQGYTLKRLGSWWTIPSGCGPPPAHLYCSTQSLRLFRMAAALSAAQCGLIKHLNNMETSFHANTIPTAPITLWHEIIAKIIPWELFFVIYHEFWAFKISRKERHFFRELHVKFVIFCKIIILE